jgi:AcrR family transcriptional regulator
MQNAQSGVNQRLHATSETDAAAAPGVRRAKDSALTRARILAAAQSVFATHGYTHGGMRQIAAAAEVNVALVARYFGSKESLFEAALDGLLNTNHLWAHPRESFGRSVVSAFVDQPSTKPHPLPVLMHAAADPVSQAMALHLIRTRVLLPLADWLGPPRAVERAAEILALTAGFFAYRIMIPLEHFTNLDEHTRAWLETSLQAIVDGDPRGA